MNYFQIQEQVNNHSSILEEASPKLQKRYNRWDAFWSNRIDANSQFSTYANSQFSTYANKIQEYSDSFRNYNSSYQIWESLGPDMQHLIGYPKHIGRRQFIK